MAIIDPPDLTNEIALGELALADLLNIWNTSETVAQKMKRMTIENFFKSVPGDMIIGGSLEVGSFKSPYPNIVTVASSGADYDSIQNAIDSITDADVDNIYTVLIYPGIYVENIVMENYVNLLGLGGRKAVQIYGTTGTLLTMPDTYANLDMVYLNMAPTASSDIALDVTTGAGVTGQYRFDNVDVVVNTSAAGIKPLAMKVQAGVSCYCRNMDIRYTLSDSTATGTFGAVDIELNNAVFYFLRSIAKAYLSCGAGVSFATIRDLSGGTVVCSITTMEIYTYNSAYNGIAAPYATYATGGFKKQISDSALNAIGTGGVAGSGYAFYFDTTTNDGDARLKGNNYNVEGYLNNYRYRVGNGDTMKSVFNQDYTEMVDQIVAGGVLQGVDSRGVSGVEIEPGDNITATSEGVAASLLTKITFVTTNGDSDLDNVTLADGLLWQEKHIVCISEGNAADTWKITPTNMIGGTQITFNGVGEGCTLVMHTNGWVVTSNNGGTIS